MIYEEFKPFLLAACFPCDQHHNIFENSVSYLGKGHTTFTSHETIARY